MQDAQAQAVPGYLGVSLRDLDAAEATRLHLQGRLGAMIVRVDRDAPAWAAGLRRGDVVVSLDGQPVNGIEMLRRQLRDHAPGETVTLRVRRENEERSFAVRLGNQSLIAEQALGSRLQSLPAPQGFADVASGDGWGGRNSSALSALTPENDAERGNTLPQSGSPLIFPSRDGGLTVDELTPQLALYFGVSAGGGLLVTSVRNGSSGAAAGMAAGDVIVRAGNRTVAARGDFLRILRKAGNGSVSLTVLRNHRQRIVSLAVGKRK